MSRSPLCECNDREAIHIKGTGPCLRRGCGCHKFREVTHDPDPVRDPVPAGRAEPGLPAPPSVGDTAACEDCGAPTVHPLLRCNRCVQERIAAEQAIGLEDDPPEYDGTVPIDTSRPPYVARHNVP